MVHEKLLTELSVWYSTNVNEVPLGSESGAPKVKGQEKDY